ncbi:protein trichome birefringence-like 19 [Typha latifolia]|uniref:protein trichome birefringence-like 19 n=1 Tax=Typha latifolia TaxID=4733 RepID=UPI003C2F82C1
MKSHLIKLPLGRYHNLHSLRKLIIPSVLIFLFLAIITLYDYPLLHPNQQNRNSFSPSSSSSSSSSFNSSPSIYLVRECNISKGEWVPDQDAPYYTNMTCFVIQEHQNCMKYGRPNLEFLKWRWKPQGCELPRFDPVWFLNLARNKSLAFVGDSLARNHMQSLMCLLSKVAYPEDISNTTDQNFRHLVYSNYNFTITIFWSPFLIKAHEADSDGPNHTGLWNLYLDEVDSNWASRISKFDYIIMSSGNWFSRPSMFYEKGQIIGCHYCLVNNITDLTLRYSHRMALRTAFQAINKHADFKGKMILRTLSPSHFENGEWNKGGNCGRTKPFQSNETQLEGWEHEFYKTQVDEFRKAEKEAKQKGLQFMLMDATEAMLLRPDGHPSRYGHWAHENVTLYNDCVHWCLPGPIDMWNDLLLQMLSM